MPKESSWQDEYIIKVYKLRRDGVDAINNVALALGTNSATLKRWLEQKPALAAAWAEGGVDRGGTGGAAREYIINRLPPKLQAVWQELQGLVHDPCAAGRLEAIFADGGRRMRQHLFLHACVTSQFNVSQAMGMVGISKATLDNWVARDTDFAMMVQEILFHKKNFIEGALMDQVAMGETSAIIFANRTQNQDRGYGKQSTVNVKHSGGVEHTHTIDISTLDLPLEIKAMILEAHRKQLAAANTPRLPGHVVPAVAVRERLDDEEAA